MGMTAAQYQRMLLKLLPPGKLRTMVGEGLLPDLLLGSADELARLDARAQELLEESVPTGADEMLAEYEAELELSSTGTVGERRARVVSRRIARQRYRPSDLQLSLAPILGLTPINVVVLERTTTQAASMGDVREVLQFFVYRDPALGGTYDVEDAQALLSSIKPSHTDGDVIESIDFRCDDPYSLCDRDILGGGGGPGNVAPVALFTKSLVSNRTYSVLDASTDSDGTIVTWDWDWGDGTGHGSTATPGNHTYATDGSKTITLVVTDNLGATSVAYQQTFTVAGWDVDATSGKGVPANTTQWNNLINQLGLAMTAPTAAWLCQDVSGNIVDSVGSRPLIQVGGAGAYSYQQNVTGWTRKAIQPANASGNSTWQAGNWVDMATTSGAFIALAKLPTSLTSGDAIIGFGDSPIQAGLNVLSAGGDLRYRNANLANGTADHRGAVRPYGIVHNVTASSSQAFTDLERLTATFAACLDDNIALGAIDSGATIAPGLQYLAAWGWTGAAAEAMTPAVVKALYTGLGYTGIPWT